MLFGIGSKAWISEGIVIDWYQIIYKQNANVERNKLEKKKQKKIQK